MGWDGILVIALTFGALILLVLERVSLDALGIGLVVVLVGSGVISYQEGLEGFSNYAVITIGALYVLGAGLTRTGAVEFLARWVLRYTGGRERRMVLLMCLIAATLSAVINNTAVMVVFIPMIVGMAQSTGVPASRLLMPLSFSAILGGMCTLVGTSTNLLVSGVAVEQGQPGIGMFEMSSIGVPLALAGILFMALFSRRLLPVRESLTTRMAATSTREYVTEILIGPQSDLLGRTYEAAFGSHRAEVLFFVREEAIHWPADFQLAIEAGDAVMIRGGVDALADLQTRLGLKLVGDLKFDPRNMHFFELAVSPHSALVGRPVGEMHLWRDFETVPVAVLRSGQHIHDRVSKLVLRPGDVVLCTGTDDSQARLRSSPDFYLLTGAERQVVLRGYATRALLIAGGVLALFTLNSLFGLKQIPLPVAALLGAVSMVATGCVSPRRAYRTIDWPILVFVVGTLALGRAMEKTGAASFFGGGIVDALASLGPAVVCSGLVLLCIIFNALISHSAVAVLLTPVALAAARAMAGYEGLGPGDPETLAITRAFILAIAFGGSICFATPIGHQTNLMVYGPGGYRYADFLRLGIPLSLVAWVIVSAGIPLVTGL